MRILKKRKEKYMNIFIWNKSVTNKNGSFFVPLATFSTHILREKNGFVVNHIYNVSYVDLIF